LNIDPLIWQLLLQAFLIGLNAIFACAEIAVISMNDAKLSKLAADGDKRALKLENLTSQPARFLATIQVAITLSGFLGSAFAADNFSERLVDLLVKAGLKIPIATLDAICVVIITVILSYFTLILGELVPKRVAMKKAEKLALSLAGLLSVISKVFKPIVWFLTVSTNAVLRLMRIDPNAEEENVTEEEIRMMIDVGTEKGTIDMDEKTMIHNVFEFDNLDAAEIATHRTKMDALFEEDTDEQWYESICETQHARYPICRESVDNVIGILNTTKYFILKDKSRENVMKNAVSQPFFVPESVKADVLFTDMKKLHKHFAVVLDEYGGVTGIITLSDILEEIVGDLSEEDDEFFENLGNNRYRVSGSISLDDISRELDIELPEDIDTLGGLVFSTLSSVPKDGSSFTCEVSGLNINVISIKEHKVAEAIIYKTIE